MGVVNRTISYKGVELDVEFYFSPSEPSVRYYADGSGYPGYEEDIELYSITHCGVDMMELLEDHFADIEEKLINIMYERD